jgi:hypothetical protein
MRVLFWVTDQEFCVPTNETTSAWVGRDYGFATTQMMQMSLVACELPRAACCVLRAGAGTEAAMCIAAVSSDQHFLQHRGVVIPLDKAPAVSLRAACSYPSPQGHSHAAGGMPAVAPSS